jgi:tRNA U34 5-methylaminomethyl-2-thiouridine-forming methyltransferase MnmC
MKREIRITADGSTTIYLPELNENYHSHHGAIQEAQHVFIKNGLEFALEKFKEKAELQILEIGFGTGLNALLTVLVTENHFTSIKYLGIEAFPVEMELLEQMNYVEQLQSNLHADSLFKKIHEIAWESYQSIAPKFQLCKQKVKLENFREVAREEIWSTSNWGSIKILFKKGNL